MSTKTITILIFLVCFTLAEDIVLHPQVIDLTKTNFYNTTGLPLPNTTDPVKATQNWFIIFYSPFCAHCKKTMPSWNEFYDDVKAKPLDKPTKIAKVDCTAKDNVCLQFLIQGYPTMMLLTPENEKKVFNYNRTAADYRKFLTEIYTGAVSTVPVDQNEEQGALSEIKYFFQNLTWAGMLMLVIMVVLVGMLVYVICDKEEEGKQFTSVVAADRESREISVNEL